MILCSYYLLLLASSSSVYRTETLEHVQSAWTSLSQAELVHGKLEVNHSLYHMWKVLKECDELIQMIPVRYALQQNALTIAYTEEKKTRLQWLIGKQSRWTIG